jgi:metal-responsive CopG/Arc/MetJ family transcriptional regulator
MEITAAIPPDDLVELDQVCRLQRVSRPDAVQEALRFYIERAGDLPTIDYGDELDLG